MSLFNLPSRSQSAPSTGLVPIHSDARHKKRTLHLVITSKEVVDHQVTSQRVKLNFDRARLASECNEYNITRKNLRRLISA